MELKNQTAKNFKKISIKNLISSLTNLGYKSTSFSINNFGDYMPEDAIWNYLDVPHLNHVHQNTAGSIPTYIDHNFVASLNEQKILGFSFPINLVNYLFKKDELIYYFTIFNLIVIINTKAIQLKKGTNVETTYYIFYKNAFIKIFLPILKKIIIRNNKILMKDDIPMRERRSSLRNMGHTVKMNYSYIDSCNLSQKKISYKLKKYKYRIQLSEFEDKSDLFIGPSDINGFRLMLLENYLYGFPRSCSHEGASYDEAEFLNGKIKCPWHGRLCNNLFKINLKTNEIIKDNNGINVKINKGFLEIKN